MSSKLSKEEKEDYQQKINSLNGIYEKTLELINTVKSSVNEINLSEYNLSAENEKAIKEMIKTLDRDSHNYVLRLNSVKKKHKLLEGNDPITNMGHYMNLGSRYSDITESITSTLPALASAIIIDINKYSNTK